MQLRIAGFMSGKGTNLIKIIEFERSYKNDNSPYKVVVIFSDNYNSNAIEIGKYYNIPVIIKDIKTFYKNKNKNLKDMNVREDFDKDVLMHISKHNVSVIAYAGYMSIASHILTDNLIGINVHPADLSILDNKKRKYTGAHAVRDAIIAGEKYIYSSSHLVDRGVDQGSIFIISQPVEVELGENFHIQNKNLSEVIVNINQENLKRKGDWIIFPLTLKYFSEGRFELDDYKNVLFDGNNIPNGIRMRDNYAI